MTSFSVGFLALNRACLNWCGRAEKELGAVWEGSKGEGLQIDNRLNQEFEKHEESFLAFGCASCSVILPPRPEQASFFASKAHCVGARRQYRGHPPCEPGESRVDDELPRMPTFDLHRVADEATWRWRFLKCKWCAAGDSRCRLKILATLSFWG